MDYSVTDDFSLAFHGRLGFNNISHFYYFANELHGQQAKRPTQGEDRGDPTSDHYPVAVKLPQAFQKPLVWIRAIEKEKQKIRK